MRNRLVQSMLRNAVRASAERYFHGRLLDIGCGDKPYESILADLVTEHVGVEHAGTTHGIEHADIVATAYSIPVPSGTFDCALMTEVLEHLEEPKIALGECFRTLRPGATLIVTTPFIWHIHEAPRDFFRFTNFGLTHLLRESGFEVLDVRPLGGFWSTFGQLLVYNAAFLDRGILGRSRVGQLVSDGVLGAASLLERRLHRPAWASHFVAVGRVPMRAEAAPDA